jgi:hypothetical protein
MRSIRRPALGWLVVVAAAPTLVACMSGDDVTEEPSGEISEASTGQCERGANGFRDIPDDQGGALVLNRGYPVTLDSRIDVKVVLDWAYDDDGKQIAFAKIAGRTIAGDLVWMDWSRDHGRTWIQCGPFIVSGTGASKTSAAKPTSTDPNYMFRACGRLGTSGPPSRCGAWW